LVLTGIIEAKSSADYLCCCSSPVEVAADTSPDSTQTHLYTAVIFITTCQPQSSIWAQEDVAREFNPLKLSYTLLYMFIQY